MQLWFSFYGVGGQGSNPSLYFAFLFFMCFFRQLTPTQLSDEALNGEDAAVQLAILVVVLRMRMMKAMAMTVVLQMNMSDMAMLVLIHWQGLFSGKNAPNVEKKCQKSQ